MLNFQLTRGSGGTCTYQIQVSNTYRESYSNNWVFTQAIDYLDAVELIVNATVRFSSCIQRRVDTPPCVNDYVILYRYDTTPPPTYFPYLILGRVVRKSVNVNPGLNVN